MKNSEKCLGEQKTIKGNNIKIKTTFVANLQHLKKKH